MGTLTDIKGGTSKQATISLVSKQNDIPYQTDTVPYETITSVKQEYDEHHTSRGAMILLDSEQPIGQTNIQGEHQKDDNIGPEIINESRAETTKSQIHRDICLVRAEQVPVKIGQSNFETVQQGKIKMEKSGLVTLKEEQSYRDVAENISQQDGIQHPICEKEGALLLPKNVQADAKVTNQELQHDGTLKSITKCLGLASSQVETGIPFSKSEASEGVSARGKIQSPSHLVDELENTPKNMGRGPMDSDVGIPLEMTHTKQAQGQKLEQTIPNVGQVQNTSKMVGDGHVKIESTSELVLTKNDDIQSAKEEIQNNIQKLEQIENVSSLVGIGHTKEEPQSALILEKLEKDRATKQSQLSVASAISLREENVMDSSEPMIPSKGNRSENINLQQAPKEPVLISMLVTDEMPTASSKKLADPEYSISAPCIAAIDINQRIPTLQGEDSGKIEERCDHLNIEGREPAQLAETKSAKQMLTINVSQLQAEETSLPKMSKNVTTKIANQQTEKPHDKKHMKNALQSGEQLQTETTATISDPEVPSLQATLSHQEGSKHMTAEEPITIQGTTQHDDASNIETESVICRREELEHSRVVQNPCEQVSNIIASDTLPSAKQMGHFAKQTFQKTTHLGIQHGRVEITTPSVDSSPILEREAHIKLICPQWQAVKDESRTILMYSHSEGNNVPTHKSVDKTTEPLPKRHLPTYGKGDIISLETSINQSLTLGDETITSSAKDHVETPPTLDSATVSHTARSDTETEIKSNVLQGHVPKLAVTDNIEPQDIHDAIAQLSIGTNKKKAAVKNSKQMGSSQFLTLTTEVMFPSTAGLASMAQSTTTTKAIQISTYQPHDEGKLLPQEELTNDSVKSEIVLEHACVSRENMSQNKDQCRNAVLGIPQIIAVSEEKSSTHPIQELEKQVTASFNQVSGTMEPLQGNATLMAEPSYLKQKTQSLNTDNPESQTALPVSNNTKQNSSLMLLGTEQGEKPVTDTLTENVKHYKTPTVEKCNLTEAQTEAQKVMFNSVVEGQLIQEANASELSKEPSLEEKPSRTTAKSECCLQAVNRDVILAQKENLPESTEFITALVTTSEQQASQGRESQKFDVHGKDSTTQGIATSYHDAEEKEYLDIVGQQAKMTSTTSGVRNTACKSSFLQGQFIETTNADEISSDMAFMPLQVKPSSGRQSLCSAVSVVEAYGENTQLENTNVLKKSVKFVENAESSTMPMNLTSVTLLPTSFVEGDTPEVVPNLNTSNESSMVQAFLSKEDTLPEAVSFMPFSQGTEQVKTELTGTLEVSDITSFQRKQSTAAPSPAMDKVILVPTDSGKHEAVESAPISERKEKTVVQQCFPATSHNMQPLQCQKQVELESIVTISADEPQKEGTASALTENQNRAIACVKAHEEGIQSSKEISEMFAKPHVSLTLTTATIAEERKDQSCAPLREPKSLGQQIDTSYVRSIVPDVTVETAAIQSSNVRDTMKGSAVKLSTAQGKLQNIELAQPQESLSDQSRAEKTFQSSQCLCIEIARPQENISQLLTARKEKETSTLHTELPETKQNFAMRETNTIIMSQTANEHLSNFNTGAPCCQAALQQKTPQILDIPRKQANIQGVR